MTRLYISPLKRNMAKESSLEFRLKKIGATRKYLLEETKQKELISKKHKKTCKYLNLC